MLSLLLFSCLLFNFVDSKSSVLSDYPKLSVGIVDPAWDSFTIDGKRTFYSVHGVSFQFICYAPYPIEWEINGVLNVTENSVIISRPYSWTSPNLQTPTYSIYIAFPYNLYMKLSDSELVTAVEVVCKKLDEAAIAKSAFLFSTGGLPTIGASKVKVVDSKLIPCYTTDPVTPTYLFRIKDDGDELVDNVEHILIEGFHSRDVFEGEFKCKQGKYSVNISAVVSERKDYQVFPESSNITAFSDEEIILRCASQNKTVQLKFKTANVTITWRKDEEKEKEVSISVPVYDDEDIFVGDVECVLIGDGKEERVHGWEYSFHSPPKLLSLSNFFLKEGAVRCETAYGSPKEIKLTECSSAFGCNLRSSFLHQNYPQTSSLPTLTLSKMFRVMNGVANCEVFPGLSRSWEYYMALDFKSYTNCSERAPTKELMRLDPVPSILHVNKSTEFVCTSLVYYFPYKLSYDLEFKNGSRFTLDYKDKNSPLNFTWSTGERIWGFNEVIVIDIYLPIDTVAVHCSTPWWNSSTNDMEVTAKFEMRYLQFPTIKGQDEVSEDTFYVEETDRLKCEGEGEPQPSYLWLFKENDQFRNAIDIFPTLKSVVIDGVGYLEFTSAAYEMEGSYKCVATNSIGKVEKAYLLRVTERPSSSANLPLISCVIIFTLIIGILVIVIFRVRRSKMYFRQLSDAEVQLFEMGRPELINKEGELDSPQTIMFLPYDRKYEIPMKDIEFDRSHNFLGSGEFSYVVKGSIKSSSEVVALKFTKPTADVNLFQSLLYEVKVQIYLGEHENIVRLVGVCTEDIRNRSLCIATELCELGSLEYFLQNSKPDFCNLVDANQQIDRNLMGEEDSLSTLDLIIFAAQIAKGMEYLAHKSVVHGDLAARNVLLTIDRIAKISDYGLSRQMYSNNCYVKKTRCPLPWRWMPPESLSQFTFSTQSDVWSYGVTLFEIFTLGGKPFPNDEWSPEFLQRLTDGMRMGRPEYSTPEIFSQIGACWETEPHHRPCFSRLRSYFEQLLVQHGIDTSALFADKNKRISEDSGFKDKNDDSISYVSDNECATSTSHFSDDESLQQVQVDQATPNYVCISTIN